MRPGADASALALHRVLPLRGDGEPADRSIAVDDLDFVVDAVGIRRGPQGAAVGGEEQVGGAPVETEDERRAHVLLRELCADKLDLKEPIRVDDLLRREGAGANQIVVVASPHFADFERLPAHDELRPEPVWIAGEASPRSGFGGTLAPIGTAANLLLDIAPGYPREEREKERDRKGERNRAA